jgi:nucleoside-diphosphate-sugar epimerase
MKNYIDVFLDSLVNKKIIISGCNGYIGTELVNQFKLNNISFIGIDKTTSSNNNCLNFNLSQEKQLNDIISKENPDYFFHMGTHSALAYNKNLLNVFNEDLLALKNIILTLKENNKTQLIYFSSSYVYSGINLANNVNEKMILSPTHNFGLAKLFFEELIIREYPNYVIFRLSSVFGKGKYIHPNAITIMAQEAMNNKLLTIWGKGKRKMQYIFLEDVIKYMLKVPELQSGIYNLGGHSYDTVMATANHIADYFGAKTKILPNKKEGETLPPMDNNKVIDALEQDFFSDHKATLTQYLADISNLKT